MRKKIWFLAAWAFAMAGFYALAWVFDTPTGTPVSIWRFFSMYAVMFTFGPLVVLCIGKGMR